MEEAKDAIPRLHLQTLNHYNPALAFIVRSRDLSLSVHVEMVNYLEMRKGAIDCCNQVACDTYSFWMPAKPCPAIMMTQLHESWRLWGTRCRDMPNTRDKILFPSSPPNIIQVKTQDTISELQLPKLMQKITSQTPKAQASTKGLPCPIPHFHFPPPLQCTTLPCRDRHSPPHISLPPFFPPTFQFQKLSTKYYNAPKPILKFQLRVEPSSLLLPCWLVLQEISALLSFFADKVLDLLGMHLARTPSTSLSPISSCELLFHPFILNFSTHINNSKAYALQSQTHLRQY